MCSLSPTRWSPNFQMTRVPESSNPNDWKLISGYSARNILRSSPHSDTVTYSLPHHQRRNPLKLIFLSDLHYDNHTSSNFIDELILEINRLAPDIIISGGDMASYAAYLPHSFNFLSKLKAPLKIAAAGNWDKRRRRWFPYEELRLRYQKAGFKLMINEGFETEDVSFYCMDDFKTGMPEAPSKLDRQFNCVISHNPDAAVSFIPEETLEKIDLILCGHTHGGQIRFPMLGALRASSIYGRKFAYGSFEHLKSGCRMIVSSGLGNTLIPLRTLCRPEIVFLNI